MMSFFTKIINKNKVVLINETDLKPKGRTAFTSCPANGVLYVFIDIENFESRSQRLLPSDFFENICLH